MFKQYWKKSVAVLGGLGLLACGDVNPQKTLSESEELRPEVPEQVAPPSFRSSPQALSIPELAPTLSSGGGVELTTNSIQGTVRYTNQDSEILTLLSEDPWRYGQVYAYSTAPSGYSASTGSVTFVNPGEYTFEILVEAGAGGADGVDYSLYAYRGPGYWVNQWTASGVNVKKKDVQPDPTQVTMEMCMGVVRFVGGTDETCATPLPLDWVSPGDFVPYAKSGKFIGYVPDGYNRTANISYSVSSSSGSRTGSRTVNMDVSCDEIVTVCLPQPPPPPPPAPIVYGGLSGPWEVTGETALMQYIYLWGGPQGVWQSLTDTSPVAPISDPSSWWTLTNLPEGSNYYMYSTTFLRSGREGMQAWTPYVSGFSVVGNQTTPVTQQVNGETRYPYVMQPSYFYGSVRLVDPYVTQHPGASSSLQALYFGDYDSNGDGFPDCIGCGTMLYSYPNAWGGGTVGAFRDRFNASTGQLSSTYEQALLSTYNQTLTWYQNYLRLYYYSYTGDSDPANHLYGDFYLRQYQNYSQLAPGDRYRVDHEYCLNDVWIEYWTTGTRFFGPVASVNGSLTGPDWRGQNASYVGWGTFYGTPTQFATAQTRGSIKMALPQGTYTVAPSAYMINSAGQVNSANFAPISMELGCGQRVKVVPPLTVSISPMTGCAQSSSATVSGVVKSAPAQVDRIWYRLNGGPEVTLCQDCGDDPSFSFTVPLQACGNSVEVFAYTDGMPEPATGYQQVVWDDPADGPSCAGAYCVNQPPVARCRSVTVPVDATCGGADVSINDGSFDPDTGDTLTCVQSPEGPYSAGSRRVTLTCTDSTGLTSSCEATVTVRDMTPPTITCPSTPQLCPAGGDMSGVVTASDNCNAEPDVTCSRTGDQTTCTATDAAGNHASCSFTCTSCFNVSLSDYNLFLLENYSGGHDVQGKVAAGGNITLSDFSVGEGVPDGDIAGTLVAQGDLTLTRGGVWGDAWHGGSYTSDQSVTFVRGTASQGTPIDFTARGAQLRGLSAQLDGLPVNGTTTREPWGGIFLHGTNSSVNVFQVEASAFTGAALLSIDAPAGSLAVLNIHGASATFTGFGHSFSGGIDQHGVLYNFVDATAINAHGYGFWGTVLAPYADIDFSNGSFDGGIYAKSLTGNAEGHINPLNDHNVCPTP